MNIQVITPHAGSSQLIGEALLSCHSTHFGIEHIVCDAASTEGLQLAMLRGRFPNPIRWLSSKDSGPAAAVNRGFQLATADIVGWLNSDDVYAKGAIDRAMRMFKEHPRMVMVYGLGRHIDLFGKDLGAYPTLPLQTDLKQFMQGSFICQPTVFVRRSVINEVGGLDESLKTAFDFDWFIRIFKHYGKRRIGLIPKTQAYSRLHAGCITQKARLLVCLESMLVLKRHFGVAPSHWVKTYFNEHMDRYPFVDGAESLIEHAKAVLSKAKPLVSESELAGLVHDLQEDHRVRFSHRQVFVDMHPDGWVSQRTEVRLRYKPGEPRVVVLSCRGGWPLAGILHLRVTSPDGNIQKVRLSAQDEFLLSLEAPECQTESFYAWKIETRQAFVPALHQKKSTDTRKLSFLVDGVKLV